MFERGGQLANEHGGQQHTFLYVGHCRMSAINAGDEPVLPPGFRWDRPWQGAMGPPTALFFDREEVGRLVQSSRASGTYCWSANGLSRRARPLRPLSSVTAAASTKGDVAPPCGLYATRPGSELR